MQTEKNDGELWISISHPNDESKLPDGFGFAVTQRTIIEHSGAIESTISEKIGTTIRVRLPVHE